MSVARLPKVYTVAEAAEKAHVSVWMIRKEIKEGRLTARYIGRCVRVLDEDLGDWLRHGDGPGRGRQARAGEGAGASHEQRE